MASTDQTTTVRPADQRRAAGARPRHTVAPSRQLRRTAVHPGERRDGRPILFGWGATLSRAERERAQIRLAVLALSGVLALVALLVGGTLLWDKVIVAQRPVLRLDSRAVSLQQYANLLAYRQNVLDAEYQQALALASQPPASGDSSDANFVAQFARQRLAQIDAQRAGLSTKLVDDIVDSQLIRTEAARRSLVATPDEVDKELKQLVGYQDPNATPVPTPSPVPAPDAESSAGDATAATAAPSPAATAAATPSARASRRADSFAARYRDYQRFTGGTDALIRQEVVDQIVRRKLGEALGNAVPSTAEQVHARHILVPDDTAAQAVRERLKNGEDFEALAAELSTDTSNKDKGGDLGWFPRGVMVSQFEDAAFKLQPGQTSEPLKTQFGSHIIRVDERDADRPLEPAQYESLKSGALSKWLESEKKNHTVDRLLTPDMIDWAERNGPKPAVLAAPSRSRR